MRLGRAETLRHLEVHGRSAVLAVAAQGAESTGVVVLAGNLHDSSVQILLEALEELFIVGTIPFDVSLQV